MKCLTCNTGEMICKKEKYHYKESGLDNIYLEDIDICLCSSCNEEIVSIPAIPGLHRMIGENLIKKKTMLNGKEIRFLRKNAGLSAKKFSGIIGVDKATVSRWENGSQDLAASNDRFIRLLYSEIKNIPKKEILHLINNGFEEIKSVREIIPYTIPLREWCRPEICCS